MFDHVTIRVGDRAASERFYATVLAALGIDETYRTSAFSESDGNNIEVVNHHRH